MSTHEFITVEGQILDDGTEITITQLCRRCSIETDWATRLIDEGIIEPVRRDGEQVFFAADSMRRTLIVTRLRRDLGVNLAGAALALELLERIDALQSKVRAVDSL